MLSMLMKYSQEKHCCPHCSQDLSLCHAPPVHVGDGLGWGSEYLFICLNDSCPMFVKGWDFIADQYGRVGSYRYMELPNSKEQFSMMVITKDAFTGSIVDLEAIKRQDERYQRQQEAIAALDTCVAKKDPAPVLTVLLDDSVRIDERKRAITMLTAINDTCCIEPLRNHVFRDPHLQHEVNLALGQILARHYLKECPYCSELIKARAIVCKHCQREVTAD